MSIILGIFGALNLDKFICFNLLQLQNILDIFVTFDALNEDKSILFKLSHL